MEAAREKQATAERNAREQRRLNRRLKVLVAVATVIALAAAAGVVGIYFDEKPRPSKKSQRPRRSLRKRRPCWPGDVDGNDVQAFMSCLMRIVRSTMTGL